MASPTPIPDTGIARSTRDYHPQHFSIRITRFSVLAEQHEKYESFPFEAGGYKWSLLLYPKGNTKCFDVEGYISLYLAIQDTDSFPKLWDVYVDFKVLVFDHIHNNYMVFGALTSCIADKNIFIDLGVKRFHELKTVLGFDKFLSVEAFNDFRNGYLVDDSCIFGAEVFIIKPPTVYESIYSVMNPSSGFLRWKIKNFSQLISTVHNSEEFTSESLKWRLRVQHEDSTSEKHLSIYLDLVEAYKLGSKERKFVNFELRLLNSNANLKLKQRDSILISADAGFKSYGWRKVRRLEDILNFRLGFINSNSIDVEAEIMFITSSKVVS